MLPWFPRGRAGTGVENRAVGVERTRSKISDAGIDDLLLQIKNHWNCLEAGGLEDYQRQKAHTELLIHFRRLLLERAVADMASDQEWQDMVEGVLNSEIDPLSAAAELVEKVIKYKDSRGGS